MGKSLSRDEKKTHKFISRESSRKFKEQTHQSSTITEPAAKLKPKVKWKPHSERDVE